MCYGVEAQVHADSSTPEYVIVDDPADPIFYSTCYVRERSVAFKPIGGASNLAKGAFSDTANETTVYNSNVDTDAAGKTWKVNGACMSCKSYNRNLGNTADDSQAPPRWVVNDENDCRSCDAKTDLLLSKCNATAGITKAKVAPCFKASASVCPAPVAVPDRKTCADAVKVATASGVDVDVDVADVDSPSYPVGCSIRNIKGVLSSYFNTALGNTTSCLGAVDTALAGTYHTALGTSVAAKIVPEEAAVVLTLRGPADGWFAFGFSAKRMGDFPHTMVVEAAMDNVKVSEWRLGSHARGTQINAEAFAAMKKGKQYWLEAGCTNATQSEAVDGDWAVGDEAIGHVQCCSDKDASTCSREEPGASQVQTGCAVGYDHAVPPCAHDGVNAYMKKSREAKCDAPGDFELTVEQCSKAAAWLPPLPGSDVATANPWLKRLVSPITSKNPLGGREYGASFPQGCMHAVSKNTARGDRSVRWNRNGVDGTSTRTAYRICGRSSTTGCCANSGCLSSAASAGKTHSDAAKTCATHGQRLCSKQELQDKSASCCSGNKCGHNSRLVWASDARASVSQLEMLGYSTTQDEATGKSVFEVVLKRPLQGETKNHYR